MFIAGGSVNLVGLTIASNQAEAGGAGGVEFLFRGLRFEPRWGTLQLRRYEPGQR